MPFSPACLPLLLGGLPYRSAAQALEISRRYAGKLLAWPQLPQRGAYRVEAFIPAGVANASVEYRVMDRPGQPDAEIVTPPMDQGRFSNQWINLGDYDFDPAQPDAGKVSLTDVGPDNPSQTVVFGAMRWVRLPR